MRGHEDDHVTRECLVREGPKDKNSKVHYICIHKTVKGLCIDVRFKMKIKRLDVTNIVNIRQA